MRRGEETAIGRCEAIVLLEDVALDLHDSRVVRAVRAIVLVVLVSLSVLMLVRMVVAVR